jgi:hypothetical protein
MCFRYLKIGFNAAAGILFFLAFSSSALLADDAQKLDSEYEFNNYRAACHGIQGRGDGATASALKQSSTDLTRLAKQNNGVVPYDRVFAQIHGKEIAVVHGREMPLWGERYNLEVHDQALVRARILELVTYVKRLQE